MSPLPSYMTDRWANRTEPSGGQGKLYWHILLRNFPQVQAIAAIGQEKLAGFDGFHFTPKKWLHITTLVAGYVDEYSTADVENMIDTATRLLALTSPIKISLGKVLFHPEAIVLAVQPSDALDYVYSSVETATRATGRYTVTAVGQSWNPHVTLAYSTSTQPADPIIDALGRKLPSCEIIVDRVSLVVQEGPERHWNWRTIAGVPLVGSAYQ